MTSRRQRRVAEYLLEEISMIAMELNDPQLTSVTVTDVEVSPDLKHARVYVSRPGDAEDSRVVLSALQHAAGFMRRELASRSILRNVPELSFHWDTSAEQGSKVDELLRQIGLG